MVAAAERGAEAAAKERAGTVPINSTPCQLTREVWQARLSACVKTPMSGLAACTTRQLTVQLHESTTRLHHVQGDFRKALESRVTAGLLLAASLFLVGSLATAGGLATRKHSFTHVNA